MNIENSNVIHLRIFSHSNALSCSLLLGVYGEFLPFEVCSVCCGWDGY